MDRELPLVTVNGKQVTETLAAAMLICDRLDQMTQRLECVVDGLGVLAGFAQREAFSEKITKSERDRAGRITKTRTVSQPPS